MVSLRFPFRFSPNQSPHSASRFSSPSLTVACAAAAVAVVGGAGAAIAVSAAAKESVLLKNSQSLTDGGFASESQSQSKAGASFPGALDDGSKRLLGVGLRRKSIFGLKNIDVYAFGVYADENDVKKALSGKLGDPSASDLKDCNDEILDADIPVVIRLQIVYGNLSIGSVRSAFKESVGSRLHKFGGPGNQELLERFTSQFKDEFKIPKGAVIDMARDKGYVLRTTIDGTEVGSIQSKLLCKSILDLYIGKDPFDKQVRDEIELKLASLFQK